MENTGKNAESSYEIGYGKPPIGKPFQSGNSGKPKGARASKTIIREILSLLVENPNAELAQENPKIPAGDAIWLKAMAQAMAGDKEARRDLYDRLEGKPVQRNENEERKVEKFASEDSATEFLEELATLNPDLLNPENGENDSVNNDLQASGDNE